MTPTNTNPYYHALVTTFFITDDDWHRCVVHPSSDLILLQPFGPTWSTGRP